MVTKRVPIPLPKRTEKEKETAKMPEAALEPEPEDEAEEEIQEIPPQPAAQKKPARARLLRARKGVAADNLVCIPLIDLWIANQNLLFRTKSLLLRQGRKMPVLSPGCVLLVLSLGLV
jgi:hypothetical protein